MSRQLEKVDKTIKMFRDYVIREAKDNLKRGGQYGSHNNTSALSNSIKGEIVTEDKFSIVGFSMADYGAFQDKGVKGKLSSLKAPNSPFKFGSGTGKKGGLTEGINKWVKARRIQFKKKDGKFMSYESTAFMITRSIYNKGIRPSLFFTKPFEAGYKKYITEDLIKGFALDVEDLMKTSLKDNKK